MKAENTASPNNSESAQSSTMEKVRGKKVNEQLLLGEQTSPNYTLLPVSVSLQSSCQNAASLDTMFTCLPSIPSATNQNPAEAEEEAEAEAGSSEYFPLRSASSSACVSSSS